MRMIFDPLCKLLNSDMFCFLYNWVWRSWHSEINVVFLFFGSTVTGLPVLVWSLTTCLGVNTQRSVDSCPHTCLPVLVGSVTLSCFSWLRVSWSNLVRFRVSSLHFVTSLLAFDNWVLGFSSIRWMSLLLLATSESKLHVQLSERKSSAVVEVTHTLSDLWFLQISSQLLSRRNCSESVHWLVVKDQWDCVLKDLEELEGWKNSCPDGSLQYWFFFLLPPPPAILLFHTSSDQYCEHSNLFWRSSFSLQNSTAPSSSRGNSPCRRRVFSLLCHWVRLIKLSSWFNIKSMFFREWVQSFKMSKQLKVFSVLLWPWIGLKTQILPSSL